MQGIVQLVELRNPRIKPLARRRFDPVVPEGCLHVTDPLAYILSPANGRWAQLSFLAGQSCSR